MSTFLGKTAALAAISVASTLVSVAANAALVNLGDGTVKDTTTNLIWLSDWNSNGGLKPWATHKAWAEGLTFAGSDKWTLPTTNDFIGLWSSVGSSLAGLQSTFVNVQASEYWTSEEFDSDFARNFYVVSGSAGVENKQFGNWAVAVRVNDNGPGTNLPEPASYALVLAAMALAASVRGRAPGQ